MVRLQSVLGKRKRGSERKRLKRARLEERDGVLVENTAQESLVVEERDDIMVGDGVHGSLEKDLVGEERDKKIQELESKYPRISREHIIWFYERKDKIWLKQPNNQVKLSLGVLWVLRSIFGMAYRTICIDRGVHTNICNVKIVNDRVVYLENHFKEPESFEEVKTCINDVKDLVMLILDVVEKKVKKAPMSIKKFVELCNDVLFDKKLAKELRDLDKLRKISYYIFKNPLVYNRNDEFLFLFKIWNLITMDEAGFLSKVELSGQFDKYVERIQAKDKELDHNRCYKGLPQKKSFKGGKKKGGKSGASKAVNTIFERPENCIRLMLNIIRHFQGVAQELQRGVRGQYNLDQILHEAVDRYYMDVIPIVWYQMTKALWKDDDREEKTHEKISNGFYLHGYSTLQYALEKEPKILEIFNEIIDRSLLPL